jgi:hypothetical protein
VKTAKVKAYRVNFLARNGSVFYGFVRARVPSEARKWAERHKWSDETISEVTGPYEKDYRQVMN